MSYETSSVGLVGLKFCTGFRARRDTASADHAHPLIAGEARARLAIRSILLLALLGTAAFTLPAHAGCVTSNGVVTCTGAVSDVDYNDAYEIIVKDLTQDVDGGVALGSYGADADPDSNGDNGGGSNDVIATFDGQKFGITSPYPDPYIPYGLLAVSQGGLAASGDHDTKFGGNAHADPGGQGGDAGDASVSFQSGFADYTVSSTSVQSDVLVSAQSIGGAGGAGGEGKVDSFGAAYGGAGGIGGRGGSASVSITSGRFNLTNPTAIPSYGILALSQGGYGGAGGEGHSEKAGNAHGGDGGLGNDAGPATIAITSASITMLGSGVAVAAYSFGGAAPIAGVAHATSGATYGGQGGFGGNGSTATVNLGSGGIGIVASETAIGVEVLSQGADASAGGEARTNIGDSHGGDAQLAGAAGAATLTLSKGVSISAENNTAVHVGSIGGAGGAGGYAKTELIDNEATGGDGFFGGNAGTVTVNSTGGPATISTDGGASHAILAESTGGQGGNGGDADARVAGDAQGGDGGPGGNGGAVNVDLWADLTTQGNGGQGLYARSYGGAGGEGGNAHAAVGHGSGGAGGGSAPSGAISLTFEGSVTTNGDEANALLANSVGGFSGAGGSGSGLFGGFGAGSQSAGDGGVVSVNLTEATLTTKGASSYGVQALSVGGGGGRGGTGDGLIALGGSGSAGGDGYDVSVSIDAASKVATSGTQGFGVHAISVGGGGGDGGATLGILSLGGSGGTGGSGSRVTIVNDGEISTEGYLATGVYAISLGGGGGSAHSTSGIEAIGGSGGGGGSGGPVTVDNSGVITTVGDDADAVFAQSIGGGGGHGSNAYSGGIGFSQAIGGSGGSGGFANTVTYTDTGSAGRTISTSGDRSSGVFLQSVGGGGGDGGNAVAVSGGAPVNVALGSSGPGGSGGPSGWVWYQQGKANIVTAGDHSAAIEMQSVGGGGGNAGSTFTFSGPSPVNFTLGLGASGGAGGDAGTVVMNSSAGALTTSGDDSPGLLAQTIGGGGGNGGNTISGNLVAGVSLGASIGGSGGTGGNSGDLDIDGGGSIATEGKNSSGIFAQAIGGGGGNGGATVAGSGISEVSADVAVGGSGGSGGAGGKVDLAWGDNITTIDANSTAVLAQSIGGGGGHSGTTVAGAASSTFSAQVAVGGKGGSGGDAGNVDVALSKAVATSGDLSVGLMAQSVGGGGGSAGVTLAGTAFSSVSANVSVGGAGGQGGNAGSVTVAVGDASTQGASSVAVEAESIGGGGGSADFTGSFTANSGESANVAVGGKGGAAGDGGAVSVTVNGSVATAGHNSTGVSAMSIGGGGGNGSWTVAGSLGGSFPVNVSVGGDGGTSGSGGMVTVLTDNDATITTAGHNSDGILAASIARAGGSAGYTLSGSGFSGADAGVSVGGTGGTGGNASAVNVTNGAKVTTQGYFADAVAAQSVGGGGGSAKGSIDASVASMGDASVTLGGKGGAGGNAGDVTFVGTSTGALITEGYASAGILAQSLGGSGGNGGFAAEGSLTVGKYSGEVGVAIGGAGGDGGSAGKVSVSQLADISTSDFASLGIIAQSIGGSGGSGGNAYAGNISISTKGSATANVDIGGSGGSGATADTVTVNSGGTIATDGYFADGILAQSIGGNGGRGGSAYTALMTASKGSSMNVGVTVGGAGGSGEDASSVAVTNSGTITTGKGGSAGIIAMSVGGGGGRGGSAANLNLNPVPSGGGDSSSLKANVQFAVGGKGGAAGDGKNVTIKNTGTVATAGKSSHGIYALSIGGGGGEGGSASATSISFNGVCRALSGGAGYGCKGTGGGKGTNVSVSLSVAVGGSGGGGGNGGDVDLESDGAVQTSNDGSHGLVADSIGGGGGAGGNGDIGIKAWTTNKTANTIDGLPGKFTFIPNWTSVSVAIGGSGGAKGNGGTVTAGGTGTIATTGDRSFGIHAQSVGGGGGNGGAGAGGPWTTLHLGGRGSGGGDGGATTVNQSGAVTTTGEGSIGIFAQSVGDGGGTAGDVAKGFVGDWGTLRIGAGVGSQVTPGAGGGGGAVTVTAGPITTTGVLGHGIVAQSVGGSGGIAGISGTSGGAGIFSFAGGSGDGGNGGDVTITTNGAINVSGQQAYGIFAQSSAGRQGSGDTSGDVTINVNADLIASGTDGRAILAQSQGGSNDLSGTIKIAVAKGATVATAADGAETIALQNGRNNSIVNDGTIRHAGTGGYVIRTNGQKLAVLNNGQIEGSVLSQGSTSIGKAIAFDNASGATFELGNTVNLGAGGTLDNSGTLTAGGLGAVGTTNLTGTLDQTDGGTMQVDFQMGGAGDNINVVSGGQASLAGDVLPNPVGTPPRDQASGTVTFFDSAPGVASDTLTVANTATVNYSLAHGTAANGHDYIDLDYKVDYTPWTGSPETQAKVPGSLRSSITVNHTGFGNYIDDLVRVRKQTLSQGRNDYAFVDEFGQYLLHVKNVSDLVDIYDRFTPGEIFAQTDAALFSSLRFANAMSACGRFTAGTVARGEDGKCTWARVDGAALRGDTAGLTHGYDEDVFGFSAGTQFEFSAGWLGGAAISYENYDLSNDHDRMSGDGHRLQVGATLKRQFGADALSGSISGGWGHGEMHHETFTPDGPAEANSAPDHSWASAHMRFSHRFDLSKALYVKPWLDIGIEHVWQQGYRENGAGPYDLDVGSLSDTYETVSPMVELATRFKLAGNAAKASLDAGALGIVAGNGRSAEVRLAGMNGAGPAYLVQDDADTLYGRLDAAIAVQASKNVAFKASVDTLFGDHKQEYGGMVRLNVRF